MAVSTVAGSAVGSSSSTSISKPTTGGYTEQSGDLILVMCESSGTGTTTTGVPTLPTGFTEITHLLTGTLAASSATIWGYKVDSGSESWPKSFTAGSGSGFDVWSCVIARGQDSTTPTDGTATTAGATSGTTLSLAAITASLAGDLLIIMMNDANDVDVTSWPSGVTEYAAGSNATGNGVITGTKASLASGSTGTLAVTTGATPGTLQACAFLVKAPSGATAISVSDSGAGTDSVSLATISPAVTDTGSGSETAIVYPNAAPAIGDSGTGAESLSLPTLTPAPSDSGAGAEQVALNGWVTIFYDDFPGTSVDTTKWNVKDDVGDPNETAVNAENPANVTVSGSALHIVANQTAYRGMNYSAGTIDTYQKFYVRYGAIEFKAKTAHGQGLWPSLFCANDQTNLWEWEIDVLEIIGTANMDVDAIETEPPGNGTSSFHNHFPTLGFDPAAAYHIYRVEWSPSGLTWFIDGVSVATDTFNVKGQMALTLDMSLGANAGTVNNALLPAQIDVDYVRVQVPQASFAQSAALQASNGRMTSPVISLNTNPALADTATGADTVVLAAVTLSLADSAVGADGSLVIGLPVPESGVGADVAALGPVTVTLADSAAGSDTIPTLVVQAPTSDSASGAEAVAFATLSLPLPDSAAGSDAISVSVTAPVADAANGAELSVLQVGVTDAATGAELLSAAITLSPVVDTATGADSVSVAQQGGGPTTISVSDSASGTETTAIGPMTLSPASDTGAGGEAISITVPVVLAEGGTGAEVVSALVTASLVDNATGSETPTVTAAAPLPADIGTGAESVSFVTAVLPLVSDAAAGAEAVSISIGPVVADPAAGSEATPSLGAIALTVSDAATGAEVATAFLTLSLADVGVGSERVSVVQAGINFIAVGPDTSAGAEAITYMPVQYATATFLARDGSATFTARDGIATFLAHS